MREQPVLYYDLGSPYAYLAAERCASVFGVPPLLQPILVGGIFVERGYGSWAHSPERQARKFEVEGRAERYGLPPIRWPQEWPNNTLPAMRAATWASKQGAGQTFALTAFRRAFASGADLSRVEELIDIARWVGLPAEDLPGAIKEQEIKDELREATDCAWARGVVGVPSTCVAREIFYGDDNLEAAAKRWAEQSG
jgi:2-hydroxychromene-2-carboxylate isomerase